MPRLTRRIWLLLVLFFTLSCEPGEPPSSAAVSTAHAAIEAQESADAAKPAAGEVVIYTALDQIYSEPILRGFERETGIRVRAVYDSEAAKTTGLVSRLMAERDRPRCDLFWNNEIVRTIRLKEEGLLAPYRSPNAEAIPEPYKDAEGEWTGFAARARVFAWNTDQVKPEDAPRRLSDLLDPRWRGRVGMAYPLFGTTATHGAVLFAVWGEGRAKGFFGGLALNGVRILEGNMTACRAVADGELPVCLTDTDDANLLRVEGKPLDFAPIDHDGAGALLIPNTVALIKGGPNPEAGRRLIDWLLRPETEAELAASPSAQIPLHPGVAAPPHVEKLAAGPFLDPQFESAAKQLEPSAEFFKATFARP